MIATFAAVLLFTSLKEAYEVCNGRTIRYLIGLVP
jgi:hypothetical protein